MSTRAEHPNAPRATKPPRIPEQSAQTTGPHTSFFIKDTSRPQLRFSMEDPAPPRSEPVRNVFPSVWGVELPPPVFPHRVLLFSHPPGRDGACRHGDAPGAAVLPSTREGRRLSTWRRSGCGCSPIRPGGTVPVDMETPRVRLFSHPQRKNARPLHDIAPNRRPRVLTRRTRHPRNTGFPGNTSPSKAGHLLGTRGPRNTQAPGRHRPQERHRPQKVRALRNTGPEDTRGWVRPRARGSGPENHV